METLTKHVKTFKELTHVRKELIAFIEKRVQTTISDDIALAIGELGSNALRHGTPPVHIHVEILPTQIMLKVTDTDPDLTKVVNLFTEETNLESFGGRGGLLVKTIGESYGSENTTTTKTIWVNWTTTPQPAILV